MLGWQSRPHASVESSQMRALEIRRLLTRPESDLKTAVVTCSSLSAVMKRQRDGLSALRSWVRTGEAENHQRKKVLFDAAQANHLRDGDSLVVEDGAQLPVAIVEIRHEVSQNSIIRTLASKQMAERLNVLQQRSLDLAGRVDEEPANVLVHDVTKLAEVERIG